MRNPSKNVAALKQLELKKTEAALANDPKAFAAVVREIQKVLAQPDKYTCAVCGKDFAITQDHLELLVAAIIVSRKKGKDTTQADYVIGTENGRRLKFCKNCFEKWKIPIFKYVEMR